jgi:rubrerythrin
MAKKQTFESKLNKSDNKQNQIKLIRSQISKNNKSIRFSEEMVAIPDGKSIEAHLKEIISK